MKPRNYLEAYRQKNNLSIKQMADKIGYDPCDIYRLLQRPLDKIWVTTAIKFARNLGITVEELIGYSGGK